MREYSGSVLSRKLELRQCAVKVQSSESESGGSGDGGSGSERDGTLELNLFTFNPSGGARGIDGTLNL